jgi:hypothetical protein
MMTIWEYFDFIVHMFPNQAFTTYVKSLDASYLEQPISTLVYEKGK